MRTRSSSNLSVKSHPNPSTSNLKRRNSRRSKQPFILEESLVDTMTDQRTMAELLRAPTEGYAEAIVVPSILAEQFKLKHSLINMMTSDLFFGLEKDNPHDHIHWGSPSVAGKRTLAFYSHLGGSFNQQTSVVTTAMTSILKQFQATPPPSFIKAIKEICVTCGGAHPYYHCLAVGRNTFPELRDNIQGYVAAAAVNYNQGNFVYRPLSASINLMPLFVWKKLGLPELISTRMTLELANRAICTPARIARYVFVPVGKFTFPTDFVIVDYESDPRVPLILGRPLLRTTCALIDVHGEEMILCDEVKDDIFNPERGNVLPEKLLDLNSTKDLHLPHHVNPLSGSTTSSSSLTYLLEEFAYELALITFPPRNDDLQFDIESDHKEIEYLLHHDPIKDIDSILTDSIDQSNLAYLNDNLVDSMPEMFTDEHALDYSSPLLYDEYDVDLFEVESDTKNVYDDPFDSKREKIKESKLLIDDLDLPCDFLLPFEYDSFLSKDFFEVDALPSTNNEDKVFNLGILIQENFFEIITRVAQDKKLAISHASLMQDNFDPPLYELPFFK
nr:reverse transcriptase domain-containing protein [Tanacetum cinerariifolium]